MFGTWRILLAVEVAAFHLLGIPTLGPTAVFSFFVLSGYLMTAITTRTYGFSPAGIARFLSNRALRLFPNYWYACIISLLIIALTGTAYTISYKPEMFAPYDGRSWIENLTMIFPAQYPNDLKPRLSPPTWALTVEWIYYALIGLGVSRSRLTTNLWFGCSIAAAIVLLFASSNHRDLYDAVYAGSLPFSAGAWTFHNREKLAGLLSRLGALSWWHLIAAHTAFSILLSGAYSVIHIDIVAIIGNWLNIALSCFIVSGLSMTKPDARTRAFDSRIGDFSYPFYLLHWQVGALASFMLFGTAVHGRSLRSIIAFCLTLSLVTLVSLVPVYVIDPLLKFTRDRVRTTSQAGNLEGF